MPLSKRCGWVMSAIALVLSGCASLSPNTESSLDTIFTISIGGNSNTQVIPLSGTSGEGEFRHPRWSPSGDRILVYSTYDGDLYNWSSSTNVRTNLTNTTTVTETDPDWAPSGALIAYLGSDSSGIRGLYVMNADGSGQSRLLSGISRFGWAEDSSRLWAIATNGRLYMVTPSGSVTALDAQYSVESGTTPQWASTTAVTFKSDGITYLGMASGVIAIRDVDHADWTIATPQAIVDLNSGESTGFWISTTGNIVNLGRADSVALSPNGSRIAIALRGTVYTTTVASLSRTVAYDSGGNLILSMTWGADNQTLIIGTSSGIISTQYDGTGTVTLSPIGSGDYDLSPNGQTVAYRGVRREKR